MLFGLISWEHLIWTLVVSIPSQLITLYLEMRILDIRHARAFWAIELVLSFGLFPFRMTIPSTLRILIAVFTIIVLPVVFSRGGLLLRVLVAFATLILQSAGELPTGIIWTALTGAAYTNEELYRNLPLALAVGPTMTVFIIVLLLLLRRFVNRFMHAEIGESPLVLPVALVAIVPVMFFICFSAIGRYGGITAGYFMVMVMTTFVSVVQVVALLGFYVSADQYAAKRADDVRSRVLTQSVELQLSAYAHVVDRIENVARIRHDLRNQAQAALLAAYAGERGRARAQVAEMLDVARGTIRLYARTGKDEG